MTARCATCEEDFDFERIQVYYMTVTATDGGGRSNSTSVQVSLVDVNDNKPEFTRTFAAFVTENDNRHNVMNGTAVLTVEVCFKFKDRGFSFERLI